MKIRNMFFVTTAIALGFAGTAGANEPAYSRVCRTSGGIPWAITVKAKFDTVLCRFGTATIGAPELAAWKWNHQVQTSVKTYLAGQACGANGSSLVRGQDTDGEVWSLCAFSDGSVVEAETLDRGPDNAENAQLTSELR